MKKIITWPIAIITSAISLVVMCIFSLILSLVKNWLGKVAFLSEIFEFLGEILDLGLIAIAALFIACSIWKCGKTVIEKINGQKEPFNKCPVFHINNLFLLAFLAMVIVLGYDFVMLIGKTVASYTAGFQGLGKLLMFYEAIKDTLGFVRNEKAILYTVGSNGLILFLINIFSDKMIN